MRAIWKFFGYAGAAIGVVAWLGGAALFAHTLIERAGLEPSTPMAMARIGLIIAGVVIALIASVALLRATRSAVGFVVSFACGMLACLAAAQINPSAFAQDAPLGSLAALAAFGLAAVVLMLSRRMVPFLATLGVFGLFAAVGLMALGSPPMGQAPMVLGQAQPVEQAAGGAVPVAPADEAVTAPPLAAPSGEGPALPEAAAREAPGASEESVATADAGSPRALPRLRMGATRGFAVEAPEADDRVAAAAPPPPPAALAEGQVAAAAPPPAAIAAPQAADFQVAELKFNKPAEMSLGQAYVVDAVIATPGASAPLTLGNVGTTETRETQITRNVRVELVASDFDITPLHKVETVLIAPGTAGHWSWRVTPRSEGPDRRMLLQVYGVLQREGVPEGEILIKTYEEKILVKVTPMKRLELFSQSVVALWQPIAALLGVIGGVWVFFNRIVAAMRKRGAEA